MTYAFDPELGAMTSFLPAQDLADYPAWRAEIANAGETARASDQPWRAAMTVTDRTIPGSDGAPQIPVRIYRPHGDDVRPLFFFFHGGAFVLGGLDPFDSMCAGYAVNADLVVVAVEYRLAPEDPFPAGVDDCYAALEWAATQADELGINPAAIAVGGSSAGGAMAAAVSLMARDRGGPRVAFQLLLNPVLDDRLDTASARTFSDTPLWHNGHMAVMWDLYLGPDRRAVSPYAAPARATDLSGLPPAYVQTSEFDPLRDEGIAYAARMLEAGVTVELHNFPGTFHAFDAFPTTISRLALTEQYTALRRALRPT
jgi:acetyl esterase/lipase